MMVGRLLAVTAVVGLVFGVAFSGDSESKPATKPATLVGKVVKVDGEKVVVRPDQKDAKEVTVATDAKTKVTIDGKEAKVAELKVNMTATVTPAEGVAEKIEAKAPAAGGG
jgi:hypothetical protein